MARYEASGAGALVRKDQITTPVLLISGAKVPRSHGDLAAQHLV